MLFCKKKPNTDLRDIERLLFQVLNNQELIIKKENIMSDVLDNLTVGVANLTTAVATANALMVTLRGLLGPDETAALQAQIDLLTQQTTALNDGIAANQPPVAG